MRDNTLLFIVIQMVVYLFISRYISKARKEIQLKYYTWRLPKLLNNVVIYTFVSCHIIKLHYVYLYCFYKMLKDF